MPEQRGHSVSIFGLWLMLLCKRMVLLRVGDNEVWMAVKLLRPFLGSKVTSVSLYSHCGVYRIQQFWLVATIMVRVVHHQSQLAGTEQILT